MGMRGASPNTSIREIPYRYDPYAEYANDTWLYKEGSPPPPNSPLIKYAVHPYYNWSKYTEQIVPPKFLAPEEYLYWPDAAYDYPFRRDFSKLQIYNKPSFIQDHHIISIRRQIEDLWSPKFYAHVHMGVTGSLTVQPLRRVCHHKFARAMTMGWDSFGLPTHSELFSFGEGGLSTGHYHYWGAGAGGSQLWQAKLMFDHGGSITERLGNYTICDIKYEVEITYYKRTVYSQDSMRHYTWDYDAVTQNFQQPVPATFLWDEVMLYCLDSGMLILDYGNTRKIGTLQEHPANRRPLMGRDHTYNWSSCTVPDTEHQLNKWFRGSRSHTVFAPALGGAGQVFDGSPECCGKAWLERPHLGEEIVQAIRYHQTTEYEKGTGESWSKVIQGYSKDVDAPTGEIDVSYVPGDHWVEMLIGTRVKPTWIVTIKDILGRYQTHKITDIEYSDSF